MTLPEDFSTYTSKLFGADRWARYEASFDAPSPVSVRLNPFKVPSVPPLQEYIDDACPWCRNAFYLRQRPDFTLDPLLHAGAYYVQEASSMFLDEVMRQLFASHAIDADTMSCCCDLCAAPGGKSTLLRAALPDHVTLYSNEPDRRRANILAENMQKQGHRNVFVTNNYPADYAASGLSFDLVLADVPCSGEGMFRKDNDTIQEWSTQNVMKCQQLQRSIIADIWSCLRPGGILIYSTCTFNTRENEENIHWIMEQYGAEPVTITTQPEWNITPSLLPGFDAPVYRFIPGISRGEGLFMAVLRKPAASERTASEQHTGSKRQGRNTKTGMLRILSDGNPQPQEVGRKVIPNHAEALLANLPADKYPRQELTLDDALCYLHHEAIALPPDTPRGIVIVTYRALPIGFVKNIGNRANNLYPKEWKIRKMI